jgi:hypothetical protein
MPGQVEQKYSLLVATGLSAGNKARTTLPNGRLLIIQHREKNSYWVWGCNEELGEGWMSIVDQSFIEKLPENYGSDQRDLVWSPI